MKKLFLFISLAFLSLFAFADKSVYVYRNRFFYEESETQVHKKILETMHSKCEKNGIKIIEIPDEDDEDYEDESGAEKYDASKAFPFIDFMLENDWDSRKTLTVKVKTDRKNQNEYRFFFDADENKKGEIAGIFIAGLVSQFADRNVVKEEPPVFVDSFVSATYLGRPVSEKDRTAYMQQAIAGKEDYSFAFAEGNSIRYFSGSGELLGDFSLKVQETGVVSGFWNVAANDSGFIYGNPEASNFYYFDESLSLQKKSADYERKASNLMKFDKDGNPYLLPLGLDEPIVILDANGGKARKLVTADTMNNYYIKSGPGKTFWKAYNFDFENTFVLVYSTSGELLDMIFPEVYGENNRWIVSYVFDDWSFIMQNSSEIAKFNKDGIRLWSFTLPDFAASNELYDVKNGMYYFIRNSGGLIARFADKSAPLPDYIRAISEANCELMKNPKANENFLKIAESYESAGGKWLAYENYARYLEKSSGNAKAIEHKLLCEIELEKSLALELSDETLNILDEYGTETARPKYQDAMKTLERLKRLAPDDAEIISMYADLKNSFEPDSAVSSKIPSLKVNSIEVSPIFPARLNFYAKNPNAVAYLSNPSGTKLSNVKVSAYVRKYMDFPSESTTFDLSAGASDVPVMFPTQINSVALSLNEDANVQMQFTITWEEAGKKNSISVNRPVTIYRKNAMIWDDCSMLSCFISSNDPSVSDFVFANLESLKKEKFINLNFTKALLLSNALGSIPLNYVSDPINPIVEIVGNKYAIDTVRFPSETLSKKGGDCDDMTTLFCSVMEASGVATAIITTPGHVFAAFDSGFKAESILSRSRILKTIDYDGKCWIPVEITALSSGFFEAWKKASSECYDSEGKSLMEEFQVLSEARSEYPAVEFASKQVKVGKVNNAKLNESASQKVISEIKAIIEPLKMMSRKAEELSEAAKLCYFVGDNKSAIECLSKAIEIDPNSSKNYRNLSMIHKANGDMNNYKLYLSKAESKEKKEKKSTSIAISESTGTKASDAAESDWVE